MTQAFKLPPQIPILRVSSLTALPFAGSRFSNIYKGELPLEANGESRAVAVKIWRCLDTDYERLGRKLVREGTFWSRLEHPNIAPFLGVSFEGRLSNFPSLVSPYYENGDIMNFLQRNSTADRLQLAAEVVAGLCYLHTHQLIHGDMKSSNVVINDYGRAQLIDFGLSRALGHMGQPTSTITQLFRWMAPELIGIDQEDEGEPLTFATDLWACSMTVLEIFTNRPPFYHLAHGYTVIVRVLRGLRPRRCAEISPEIWCALGRCWSQEPAERPSTFALSVLLNVVSGLRAQGGLLSCQDVDSILDSVSQSSGPSSGLRGLPAAPYDCYWPDCNSEFNDLVECQKHQVSHV